MMESQVVFCHYHWKNRELTKYSNTWIFNRIVNRNNVILLYIWHCWRPSNTGSGHTGPGSGDTRSGRIARSAQNRWPLLVDNWRFSITPGTGWSLERFTTGSSRCSFKWSPTNWTSWSFTEWSPWCCVCILHCVPQCFKTDASFKSFWYHLFPVMLFSQICMYIR